MSVQYINKRDDSLKPSRFWNKGLRGMFQGQGNYTLAFRPEINPLSPRFQRQNPDSLASRVADVQKSTAFSPSHNGGSGLVVAGSEKQGNSEATGWHPIGNSAAGWAQFVISPPDNIAERVNLPRGKYRRDASHGPLVTCARKIFGVWEKGSESLDI